jgi:hypothetical protein
VQQRHAARAAHSTCKAAIHCTSQQKNRIDLGNSACQALTPAPCLQAHQYLEGKSSSRLQLKGTSNQGYSLELLKYDAQDRSE